MSTLTFPVWFSVFVVAVPEGLPLAVTIALAFSVHKVHSVTFAVTVQGVGSGYGFRVWVEGLGFRVQGLGFGVWSFGVVDFGAEKNTCLPTALRVGGTQSSKS